MPRSKRRSARGSSHNQRLLVGGRRGGAQSGEETGRTALAALKRPLAWNHGPHPGAARSAAEDRCGPDPSEWTPHKRECSLWLDHVGSSLLTTKTRP